MIKKNGTVYRLNTPNTTLVLQADTAQILYYGARLPAGDAFAAVAPLGRRFFSAPGTNDYTECSVIVEHADGSFASQFLFSRAKTYTEKPVLPDLPSSYGEGRSLELKYTDPVTRVSLYIQYTVFEDSDVIAVSSRVANRVEKARSPAQADEPAMRPDRHRAGGRHFQRHMGARTGTKRPVRSGAASLSTIPKAAPPRTSAIPSFSLRGRRYTASTSCIRATIRKWPNAASRGACAF